MAPAVGRERELDRVASFVGAAEAATVLLLEGEPGIGKTTVWEQAVAAAQPVRHVLRARPLEVEARISFAAVGDLLAGSLDEIRADLPGPQLRALETALLLAEPASTPPDRQAIAFAFLSTLRLLARSRPLLVAVDDLQWLDQPSAAVLLYSARRIDDEPVRFILTHRTGADGAGTDLDRAVTGDRLLRMELGPLSRGAIQRLLHDRLDIVVSRPTLHRIHAASGGNPFFALELARSLPATRPDHEADPPLQIPESLTALVDERLARLPDATERALQVAALLANPTVDTVAGVLGRTPRLRPALEAGVIVVDGGTISFTHPLLASGLAARIDPGNLRTLHRRISAVVTDPEEHARHLAQGASGADPEAVAALDRAAEHAATRGAPDVAAELLERALVLVPTDDPSRFERLLDASEATREAGDWARARAHAEEAAALAVPGAQTARALLELGLASSDPLPCLLRARAESDGDPALTARVLLALSEARVRTSLADALADVRAAAAAAARAGDADLLAQATASLAWLEGALNVGDPLATIDRVVELERDACEAQSVFTSEFNRATLDMWHDRHDEARAGFTAQLRAARDRGDVYGQAHSLLHLAQVEWRAGDWEAASTHAGEGLELWLDEPQGRGALLWIAAVVAVHQGDSAGAQAMSEEALAAFPDDRLYHARHAWVLGVAASIRGEHGLALEHLEDVAGGFGELGVSEPGMALHASDLIDAYLATDRSREAAEFASALERRGLELGRTRAISIGLRGRGLALAADGDAEGGLALLEVAAQAGRDWPVPLERARTLIALGSVQRRLRRRRDARATLERALGVFEALGAESFAGRAREELARIGGRAAAGDGLTPTEERVAELVAQGRTNREVASDLVLSVHTVEAALTAIYRKLGVRSRTELTRKVAEGKH